jgi:serine/threonine protein kinase
VTPQGRAKVLDFGLAKRATGQELTDATSLTQPGALIGTLAYMAPEQLRGGGADARSDVWALGVMLYEMATGARPFQARSGFELSSAIVNQPPAPLPGTVSVGLAAVIGRCLEKTPERRYQRASEVHAALESIQAGVTPRLIAEHRPHQRKSLVLRRPWVVTAIALAAAAVFGLGWWTLMQPPAPITHIDSLVVLPLDNLSRDPEQDYFVEGMHEAIIGELARIGSVRVISRTSAMRYTGTDKSIPAIGKEFERGWRGRRFGAPCRRPRANRAPADRRSGGSASLGRHL